MDEGDGLENRYAGDCIVGSNPTPSATNYLGETLNQWVGMPGCVGAYLYLTILVRMICEDEGPVPLEVTVSGPWR